MKPRMKEKGIPGKPENEFSIRNPWISLPPGKPIPSTSNGISVERNENHLGDENWCQFFELLDRSSKQMQDSNRNGSNCYIDEPPNQSSGSYSVAEHRMRNGISQSGNNFDLTASINQNSSSNGTGNHVGNRIMEGGNNHNLNEPLSRSSGSFSMADHQMGNGILRGGNNFNLAGSANQISSSNSTDNRIRNGIIQGDNNYNFTGQLNQVGSSNTTVNLQMRDGISQGGNNYNPVGQMNLVSRSNGTRNCIGNGIVQGGNYYKFSAQLNQVSNSNTRGHQMRNGILQGGHNYNPSGKMNQISSSNGTHNHIGNGIFQGGNNYNFTGQLHQVSNSSTTGIYGMSNGILQGGNNYNSTAKMNQISSSNGTGNHIGNGIIQGGNNRNLTGTLNQISSSNTMSDHQMGHQILQGGNNCNITGQMNRTNSSNSTGGHILHEIMLNGNNSKFRGLLNQITNSNSVIDHQMGNEDIHNYPNSGTQKCCNHIPSLSNSSMASNRRLIGNTVHQKTNMASVTIPRENSVISSSLLNLNRQPLSSPRVMNSQNSLILNSYSEVDNSWTEGNFTSMLLGDEIADLGSNSNFLNTQKLPQMLTDGFHVSAPDNNLCTPAKYGSDARTRNTNSFPFAPITPDQTNNLQEDRHNEMLKLFVENGSFQDHNKVVNLLSPIENEAIENRCSQLLQTIVGTSSNVVTTPQTENKIIDEKSDHDVIDLNETPKQKTPKRRKHRPKVIREGKPKKTSKTKTPKNEETERNPSNKRKYVRKNRDPDVENASHQQTDAINNVKIRTKEESCKKRLNFDFEKAEMPHHQGSQPVLDLNLNYPENQMESHAPKSPSKIINCNTSIVIAKNQKLQGELNKNISRANVNLERSTVVRWRSTHQMVERDVCSFKGFCGSKGEDSHPVQPENQETISLKVRNSSGDTRKKQKTENDFQTMLCGPEKEQFFNGSCHESTTNTENDMQRELIILNQQMARERMRKRISCRSSQVQFKPESCSTSKHADSSGYQQRSEKDVANMKNNGLKITPNPCRVISFCSNVVPSQESKEISHPYQQPSMKARGRPKSVKYSKNMVDEITSRLQRLTISGENGGEDGKEEYALVPYEGGGAIITYEAKKRKSRPKVDLDPETARLWKLLMGKEGSEASEGENKDKEKWWEEERRVFHGRAESFIARMHLVQGDRRFSPWKGSVVDSIIGVFLTQNVSDQLSSSAFMALAAQFPLSSTTPDQTSDHSGTSNLTEESEIYLGTLGTGKMGLETEPSKTIKVDASSPHNSSDSSVHNVNGEIQSFSGSSLETEDTNNWGKYIKNNGFTSVQNTNRTAPLQVLKNPENEHVMQKQGSDQFSNLNSVFSLNHPIDSNMQNSIMPPNYFQMLMASQVARSGFNYYEISREECRSSFPSRDPEITKDKSIVYWDNRVNHATTETGSNTLFQQNMDPFRKDQHSLNTHRLQRPQTYESEQIGFGNPSRPNESVITSNSGGQRTTADNKQVSLCERPNDGQAKGQSCPSGEINSKISAKTLNTSHNGEKEKKESFDWDSLRKMVYFKNGGEKERSVGSSDSMDYEAMRCSDVNVISNSIRMRGMNHMLAERIKDFLNRVVTDHGSIDLEWLRDVPPDKSKDYLLSIRGLGLKSVECVRLLTLHHLAFPVDTNVGRIAVRLGWVPLHPLPESLQLHLLEMYPVLETVQKYLWPRLCKLDQKTLYELHYQLITFGKVFCTKSKPNCNACPMRGECRHFASAFASARLALPAPEDKGIVNSTTPITTDRRADLAIRPMLLQPPSGSSNKERELMVNSSEPIIEEPTTPEPDIIEITETDIEDAFYEDPDEIPTIRLNVEQLAANLRNFMEEHTDLQEGDMSKALVALTPEVASIPVPKLKYVLRLRTERQVYVLTDTHPLVKGLDKREPDDPSPYLFALLTPGEEASSGQSSGKKCESKGSEELCNEKDRCPVEGEANSQTVRGTLLIPCRTATRGCFPLNGTYFQVNEVFADHESSLTPIDVPRKWLWHLETRTVFFGTSATSIFRGMTTKEIQNSFWRGFVCVRGFDRKSRAPRPLNRNLHLAQSKTVKTSNEAL